MAGAPEDIRQSNPGGKAQPPAKDQIASVEQTDRRFVLYGEAVLAEVLAPETGAKKPDFGKDIPPFTVPVLPERFANSLSGHPPGFSQPAQLSAGYRSAEEYLASQRFDLFQRVQERIEHCPKPPGVRWQDVHRASIRFQHARDLGMHLGEICDVFENI